MLFALPEQFQSIEKGEMLTHVHRKSDKSCQDLIKSQKLKIKIMINKPKKVSKQRFCNTTIWELTQLCDMLLQRNTYVIHNEKYN
jgi:hypothetical protein